MRSGTSQHQLYVSGFYILRPFKTAAVLARALCFAVEPQGGPALDQLAMDPAAGKIVRRTTYNREESVAGAWRCGSARESGRATGAAGASPQHASSTNHPPPPSTSRPWAGAFVRKQEAGDSQLPALHMSIFSANSQQPRSSPSSKGSKPARQGARPAILPPALAHCTTTMYPRAFCSCTSTSPGLQRVCLLLLSRSPGESLLVSTGPWRDEQAGGCMYSMMLYGESAYGESACSRDGPRRGVSEKRLRCRARRRIIRLLSGRPPPSLDVDEDPSRRPCSARLRTFQLTPRIFYRGRWQRAWVRLAGSAL